MHLVAFSYFELKFHAREDEKIQGPLATEGTVGKGEAKVCESVCV